MFSLVWLLINDLKRKLYNESHGQTNSHILDHLIDGLLLFIVLNSNGYSIYTRIPQYMIDISQTLLLMQKKKKKVGTLFSHFWAVRFFYECNTQGGPFVVHLSSHGSWRQIVCEIANGFIGTDDWNLRAFVSQSLLSSAEIYAFKRPML